MEYKHNHSDLLISELDFWKNWFKEKGGEYKQDYIFRTNNESEIDSNSWVFNSLRKTDKVLDVGCGPMPSYGYCIGGQSIDLIGIDPLADEYNRLIEMYTPNVKFRAMKVDGEKMLDVFKENQFDKVFSQNALDHSYNPILCIQNMVKVCKNTGIVKFVVFENEAKYGKYNGLHQWNFTIENKKLKLWNRDGATFIDDHIQCKYIKSSLQERYVFVEIAP